MHLKAKNISKIMRQVINIGGYKLHTLTFYNAIHSNAAATL
jgi:hypothetical protein